MGINMQPQLCKLLQSKLKCNILQQCVARLVYKILIFELAHWCGSIFLTVLLVIFGVFGRF